MSVIKGLINAVADPRLFFLLAVAALAVLVWKREEVAEIYRTPLTELVFRAQSVHRQSHAPDRVQTCQLISIKTGGCPEDCAYCPQSAHYDAPVERQGSFVATPRPPKPASRKAVSWMRSMSLARRGRRRIVE